MVILQGYEKGILLPSSFFHTIREALVQRRMWAGLIIILRDSAASLIFYISIVKVGSIGNTKKNAVFLCISLTYSYLCSHEKT